MKRELVIAPKGYVYDWATPRYDENNKQLHLYAERLSISKFDNINNYKLIEEVKKNVPST